METVVAASTVDVEYLKRNEEEEKKMIRKINCQRRIYAVT